MTNKVILLLALSFVAATASASPEPEPGLYRVTGGVSGQDLPPGMVEQSVEQCLTKEDLASDSTGVLSDHVEMEGCEITQYEWKNGKISMQMKCVIEGTDATSQSQGTYDANGYEMISTLKMKLGDTTLEMKSFVRAERIGDC